MKDKSKWLRGKKVFLSYLDDNDGKRANYVTLISKDDRTITFKTKNNIITIPISRVLKIKESLEGDDSDDTED